TLQMPSLVSVTESRVDSISAASRRCLRVDHRGLLDRRPADLLLEAGTLAPLVGRELDRRAALDGPVQGPDHANVGEAFLARGLGIAVGEDAVGEVEQLGRELVALREAPLAHQAAVER